MNMVLRSGTNRLHGSAFEFFRSDDLSARNFFDARKSQLLSHQFGATLGGPVVLPRLVGGRPLYHGRDRTFFLASWEALRQYSGGNRFSEVPSALERSGDFSHSVDAAGRAVVVKDPLNGNQPFPGNRIPLPRLDAISQAAAAYYPMPNSSDPTNNYHADQLNRVHWNSLLLKVDESATDNNAFSFRYLTRLNSTTSPYTGSDVGLFGSQANSRPALAGFTYTRIFGPALVNEFRAGLVRTSDHETGLYGGQGNHA